MIEPGVAFELLIGTPSGPRLGLLRTAHGEVETPAFMPVGTQGTVKALTPRDLVHAGTQIMLSNAYHLYLRPGTEILEKAGGLHRFASWNKPILTDSGGFQVFSLSQYRRIREDGVHFRSHLDGSLHIFTPEKVVDIQRSIGSDIMMVLDECPPYPSTYDYALQSLELTHRWAERAQERFSTTEPLYGYPQSLFAIVQGSVYPDLREKSVRFLTELDFPGYAIGGLSVGEPKEKMLEIVRLTAEMLPQGKPRYLMGVGKPEDLVEAVAAGVDLFDCVIPTRNARNGTVFTRDGSLVIKNARFKEDFRPIEESCTCYTCRNFSRAYVRHLLQAGEILGLHLATLHNVTFYNSLMAEMRLAISERRFDEWRQTFYERYNREREAA